MCFVVYVASTNQVPANLLQKYKKVQKYANKTDIFCQSLMILYLCTAFGHIQRPIIMPKIMKTIAPIDSISGALGNRENNLCGKVVIANVRKQGGNKHDGKPFQYFSVLTRTTAMLNPTEKVLVLRAKFSAVSRLVRTRMADASQAAQDMAAYRAQTKYKTLYSFVWHLVWSSYEG